MDLKEHERNGITPDVEANDEIIKIGNLIKENKIIYPPTLQKHDFIFYYPVFHI